MHTRLYSKEWEKSHELGPGPAAYSAMDDAGSASKKSLKRQTFSKADRMLTRGKKGPGPVDYTTTGSPERQTFTHHPRQCFNKAQRTIDVIKCKSLSTSNLTLVYS